MSLLADLIRKSTLQAGSQAQRYAEGNMIATVKVVRPGKATFDRTTGGRAKAAEQVIWEGGGRVYRISGPVTMDLGDEPVYFTSATISIPLRASRPQVGDTVHVLAHPDPNVVGRSFRVDSVAAGGQIPSVHELACTGVQASPTDPGVP